MRRYTRLSYINYWTIVNNGPGFYKIHANASDSNGTILKYFWNDNQGWKDSSLIDSSSYQFRQGDMNSGITFSIGARDDDGLLTTENLVVYADEPPPKPDIFTLGITNGNVSVYWSKKDIKDGNATQYKILLSKATIPVEDADTLVNFKKGSTYVTSDLSAYDFKYTFPLTPPFGQHGIYRYQVIAKDARSSKTYSDIGNFPY